MANEVLRFIKDLVLTLLFVAFNYFVIPWIMPDAMNQVTYFIIVTTVCNFIALMLSWNYFLKTKCPENEGNILTMFAYKFVGANITHIVLFIIRMATNLMTAIFLFTNPTVLLFELDTFFYVKIFLLTTSLTASVYFFELVNNIKSISDDEMCNEESLMCSKTGNPIYCD